MGMIPSTILGVSSALIFGSLFVLTILKMNPLYAIPGMRKLKSNAMLVVLGILFFVSGGFASLGLGSASTGPAGTSDVMVEVSAAAFSGTASPSILDDYNVRLSTTNADYSTNDDVDFNVTVTKTSPGEKTFAVSLSEPSFRDELDSSDVNEYTLVGVDSDDKMECYIATDSVATTASSQEFTYVSIGEDSSSVVISVHCEALGEMDELDQYGSNYVTANIGGQKTYLQIMRSDAP